MDKLPDPEWWEIVFIYPFNKYLFGPYYVLDP